MDTKQCSCNPPVPFEDVKGNKTNRCRQCGGMIIEVDASEWRIYKPRELVRARQRDDGDWDVFDGTKIHTFTHQQFKDTYEIAAQHSRMTRDKPPKQIFHHGRT